VGRSGGVGSKKREGCQKVPSVPCENFKSYLFKLHRGGELQDGDYPFTDQPLSDLPKTQYPGTVWFTMVYNGLQWFTIVYNDSPRVEIVYNDSQWFQRVTVKYCLQYVAYNGYNCQWFTMVYDG
jgi:hypothetical protein